MKRIPTLLSAHASGRGDLQIFSAELILFMGEPFSEKMSNVPVSPLEINHSQGIVKNLEHSTQFPKQKQEILES